MKLAVLASNFSGNVGDLYILRSVTDFIAKRQSDVSFDVFPYAKRFNPRVACVEQLELSPAVNILPHRFAMMSVIEHLSRRHSSLRRLITPLYFTRVGRLFHSTYAPISSSEYDGFVSLGGEMDTPYSFFDIHDYVNNLVDNGSKLTAYGPISVRPLPQYIKLLKQLFSSVETVAIRDPASYAWLAENGIDNIKLVPDCAFLSWNSSSRNALIRSRIGLCLHTSWAGRFEHAKRIIVQAHKAAVETNSELVLYPTHTFEDYQLYRRLIPEFRNYSGLVFEFPNSSKEFTVLSQSLDLVISDRLHGLLVGMLHGANILPIKTRHKVIGYCEYIKLEHAISLEDEDELMYSKIVDTVENKDLAKKLENFCAMSCQGVSDFYTEQLGLPEN